MDARVLVLDAGYTPIGTISWQKAFCLIMTEKVEIIEEYIDLWIHSAKQTFKVPSVVRFIRNVRKRMRNVKFSRENVYTRDKGKCQYCSIPVSREEFTLDHCIPRSKHGQTCWENVVVCCVECNRKKANKTPEEAGMRLKIQPVRPKNLFQVFSWKKSFPPEWKSFLYWNVELENENT